MKESGKESYTAGLGKRKGEMQLKTISKIKKDKVTQQCIYKIV